MSDNWFYEYFINEAKSIIRPCSGGGSVPKPLTYDYMPEGYPSKAVQTVTLLEEQEVAFTLGKSFYMARLTNAPAIAEGQTYTVNWDGTEYECVCGIIGSIHCLGNLSIVGKGSDTGEPFIYAYNIKQAVGTFSTLDTSASHTISVKTVTEVITPMAYDYMPEGYPSKAVQTVTLLEEQEVAFAFDSEGGGYSARLTEAPATVEGQTYTVNWDGTEYECVCYVYNSILLLGNLTILGVGDDTGEPFIYGSDERKFATLDTSASHTISVKGIEEIVTPIDEKYLPDTVATKSDIEEARSTANNAQTTANNAQSTANNAKTAAENAWSTASTAKTTANTAKTTANTAKTTADAAETTANTAKTTADAAKTTADAAKTTADAAKTTADAAKTITNKALILEPNGSISANTTYMNHGAYQSLSLCSEDQNHQVKFAVTESTGLQIWVTRDGGSGPSTISNPSTVEFMSSGGRSMQLSGINALIMSPINSNKKFKITVDDTGTLSATEVT